MFAYPRAAARFDLRLRLGVDRPVIKCAPARRLARDVPPPARLAVDNRQVGRHVAAFEQPHPEMAGRRMRLVVGLRPEHTAADTHAFEIDDRLGENRKPRRLGAVGPGLDPLALRYRQLVVDPAMRRVPLPGVAVLGSDIDVGLDVRKILQTPGIGFVDRHEPERGESGNNRAKGTPPPPPF